MLRLLGFSVENTDLTNVTQDVIAILEGVPDMIPAHHRDFKRYNPSLPIERVEKLAERVLEFEREALMLNLSPIRFC